jgi:hypothetical protein
MSDPSYWLSLKTITEWLVLGKIVICFDSNVLRLKERSPFSEHSDDFSEAAKECYKLVEGTEQEAERNEGKITGDQLSKLKGKLEQLKALHSEPNSYLGELLDKTFNSLVKVQGKGQAHVMFSSLGVYDCKSEG